MNSKYDLFEQSLQNLRRLRAYSLDKSYLLDAPFQIFPEMETDMIPRVVEGGEDDPSQVILTKSYARKPGKGLSNLQKIVQRPLPQDFIDFSLLYDEALITTRTYPIYLWNEERILKGIETWRDLCQEPVRFFRFGEYWDRDSLYFGLWNKDPESSEWQVVIADWSDRDQIYEKHIADEYVLATSFHTWLVSLLERDGLPDPYMTRFGTLDPA